MTDFESIYKSYFSDVYLYILRLSGDEHIAEEITSDTFFKAMKSIERFRDIYRENMNERVKASDEEARRYYEEQDAEIMKEIENNK